jgi:putative oxidoreductase
LISHGTRASRARGSSAARALALLYSVQAWLTRYAIDLALLALRLPVAVVFWRSGRTRVAGWNIFNITDSQIYLFDQEFHMPFPELTAHLTAVAEHVLPVLLIAGLFTPLAALGMLMMTLVIQFFVFPDAWLTAHMFWATILFAVLVIGPGRISLDFLLAGWLRRRKRVHG